ncbi:YqeG family HAD IIIA-type phosphatase [Pseudoflavonifractor sp. 524-17]|uniref:YqeG family HAD IIIA-type phosphatase n=1 Tax=Pseudoflavonifractor sp. 524-17 TaxID=2304577 RepID=UPI00137AA1A3|nr:YqeG family HAD IIIA-type phosphatase [Pseudoflavonifractor sp. 524-17]
MIPSLLADQVYSSVFDIEPQALAAAGIRLLLADLDNTLAPYGQAEPEEALRTWTADLARAGVRLFILSNNRRPERAMRFAGALGVPYIGHAGKPRPASFRQAMERMGAAPKETSIVGDQIFTDILGGKNAGVGTILVEPIRLAGNPGRYLRYGAEWPFRILAKRRGKKR